MPIRQHDVTETSGRFEIRPNRSMTRKGVIWVFVGISLAALLVALRFVLIGAWVVLPITTLELLVLGIAFYIIEHETRFRETIELNRESVSVVQKGWKISREWRYPAYWVQVILQKRPDWYPSRLFLRSHGDLLEIGACLNEDERQELSKHLTQIIEDNRK